MKKLLLSGAALLSLVTAEKARAQAWSQDFNTGIPANWVFINDGKVPYGVSSSAFAAKLQTQAWATILKAAGDSCMGTTSYFTPTGKADRWMITHSFTVSPQMSLVWEDYANSTTYTDSLQILVSPTAGTTASAFTTTIYNAKGSTSGFTAHAVSLNAYSGQTIRIAFRDNSTDQLNLYVDNVSAKVLPAVDAALTNLTPANGSPLAYGASGSNVTMTGKVSNYGSSALTSYNLKYQVNGGTVVSQAVTGNIASYGTATVTFSTPYTIPGTSAYNVKAWVEATGDANHTNDSATTTINGVSFMPKKRVVVEEATGTWCGWCVRGIVYMDSLWTAHPDDVSLVAVHNQDPMMISAYDAKVTATPGFSGFPGVVVDRREVKDPSDLFTVWNTERNYFGFADVTLGTATFSGNNLTVPVNVKPAINLSGDYRLALVVTEDRVHNTSGGTWDQHNYYSTQSQNLPLSNSEYNFQQLPATIPSAQMYYDFVARSITNVSGDASSLPATMTAGTTYNKTYTVPVDASWSKSKMRAVVMLIRNSDGAILNSANTRGSLGVSNVSAGISRFSVFPNPANANASARIELSQSSNVSVEVVDVMGRVVAAIPAAQMGAGEHIVTLPVAQLASGVYNVKITTEGGTLTERLSVVK